MLGWEDAIKMNLAEIKHEDWIHVTRYRWQ
jgi:hypothetical protein